MNALNKPPVESQEKNVLIKKMLTGTWSPVEHRRFLFGLKLYGRGKWVKIAKKCVLTRDSTQVASHAQKYFKKQKIKIPKVTKDFKSQNWWKEFQSCHSGQSSSHTSMC